MANSAAEAEYDPAADTEADLDGEAMDDGLGDLLADEYDPFEDEEDITEDPAPAIKPFGLGKKRKRVAGVFGADEGGGSDDDGGGGAAGAGDGAAAAESAVHGGEKFATLDDLAEHHVEEDAAGARDRGAPPHPRGLRPLRRRLPLRFSHHASP